MRRRLRRRTILHVDRHQRMAYLEPSHPSLNAYVSTSYRQHLIPWIQNGFSKPINIEQSLYIAWKEELGYASYIHDSQDMLPSFMNPIAPLELFHTHVNVQNLKTPGNRPECGENTRRSRICSLPDNRLVTILVFEPHPRRPTGGHLWWVQPRQPRSSQDSCLFLSRKYDF